MTGCRYRGSWVGTQRAPQICDKMSVDHKFSPAGIIDLVVQSWLCSEHYIITACASPNDHVKIFSGHFLLTLNLIYNVNTESIDNEGHWTLLQCQRTNGFQFVWPCDCKYCIYTYPYHFAWWESMDDAITYQHARSTSTRLQLNGKDLWWAQASLQSTSPSWADVRTVQCYTQKRQTGTMPPKDLGRQSTCITHPLVIWYSSPLLHQHMHATEIALTPKTIDITLSIVHANTYSICTTLSEYRMLNKWWKYTEYIMKQNSRKEQVNTLL